MPGSLVRTQACLFQSTPLREGRHMDVVYRCADSVQTDNEAHKTYTQACLNFPLPLPTKWR